MAENASNELHFLLRTEFFVFDPYVVHQAKRNGEVFPNFTQVPVAHKSKRLMHHGDLGKIRKHLTVSFGLMDNIRIKYKELFERGVSGRLL